ncbi:MAG: hypothetical protein GX808_12655 [Syntrophomonadaceae bacterium]|jgi:DNA primase catalytic core|nr:hypothetical protein [Syntrophomonadaceae bacterium]
MIKTYYNTTVEIKARLDIVDLISEHVRLARRGRNYWGLCPFHSEKTPSFSVNPEKQMFYCFGCKEAGDIFTFAMKINNIGFRAAKDILAVKAGVGEEINRETCQHIWNIQKQHAEVEAIAQKLQQIIDDEIKRLRLIEKWCHRVIAHVCTEQVLDIPVVSWAVKKKGYNKLLFG